MALIQHVALVPDTTAVTVSDLQQVSAALQKQVMRDLAPTWDLAATVDPFSSLEEIPIGYWPIVIVDEVGGAAGVHLDKDGQPFALVEAGSSWSLTASHECLEMLADPFGDRLVAGPSIKPDQGRVEYLVEICDPPEAPGFGYTVNGILVSDWYTPSFFDPVPASGVRYSFGGHITRPREVLRGGYLSWHDPVADHWWQQTWFSGGNPVFRDLGVFSGSDPRSVREIVDSLTPELQRLAHVPVKDPRLVSAAKARGASVRSTNSKGQAWRRQIEELRRLATTPRGSAARKERKRSSRGRG